MSEEKNPDDEEGYAGWEVTGPFCRGCRQKTHEYYIARYDGYCLSCHNAGVRELHDLLLQARKALDSCCDIIKTVIHEDASPLVAVECIEAIDKHLKPAE